MKKILILCCFIGFSLTSSSQSIAIDINKKRECKHEEFKGVAFNVCRTPVSLQKKIYQADEDRYKRGYEFYISVENKLNTWNELYSRSLFAERHIEQDSIPQQIDKLKKSFPDLDVSCYEREYDAYRKINYQAFLIVDSLNKAKRYRQDSISKSEALEMRERERFKDSLNKRAVFVQDSTMSSVNAINDEKRKEYCLKKYGHSVGLSIYNGNVKIGDTPEMVKDAWGDSYIEDTYIKAGVKVVSWTYSSFTYIIFKNGKVYMIKK